MERPLRFLGTFIHDWRAFISEVLFGSMKMAGPCHTILSIILTGDSDKRLKLSIILVNDSVKLIPGTWVPSLGAQYFLFR